MNNDKEFNNWVKDISAKYKRSQLEGIIKVNIELLSFHFELGKMISNTLYKELYGNDFYDKLSIKLLGNISSVKGLSPLNIRFIEKFYLLYKDKIQNNPQLMYKVFTIPWTLHLHILDKCHDVNEALFFIDKIHENNWSSETLLYFLDADLYKKECIKMAKNRQV